MFKSNVEPCQNQAMGIHRCKNRSQCWEPCGELGHSEEHCVPVSKETEEAISKALNLPRIDAIRQGA